MTPAPGGERGERGRRFAVARRSSRGATYYFTLLNIVEKAGLLLGIPFVVFNDGFESAARSLPVQIL